jgi:hypothetical protein
LKEIKEDLPKTADDYDEQLARHFIGEKASLRRLYQYIHKEARKKLGKFRVNPCLKTGIGWVRKDNMGPRKNFAFFMLEEIFLRWICWRGRRVATGNHFESTIFLIVTPIFGLQ